MTDHTHAPSERLVYRGAQLRTVAMPLGGLGTGSVALCGDGSLRQWQIFNEISHQAFIPDALFAIWARVKERGARPVARVLQCAETYDDVDFVAAPLVTDHLVPSALKERLAWLPGVHGIQFSGEYPLARLTYDEPALPVQVALEAFSPFIPLNHKDSGLPAIFFIFTVRNRGEKPVELSLAMSLQNAVGYDGLQPVSGVQHPSYGGNRNALIRLAGMAALDMSSTLRVPKDERFGQMVLANLSDDCTWYAQWDNLHAFWDDFASDGLLCNVADTTPSPPGRTWNGAVAASLTVAPGSEQQSRFLLAWHFPNRCVNWDQTFFGVADKQTRFWLGTMYGNWFNSALAVADYARQNAERLIDETRLFHDAMFDSTLPEAVLDAVTAPISTLRSPTCFWTADDKFYGFEGCNNVSSGRPSGGCCPLNCTHVWNHAQALARLFPHLERTMRETDLGPQMDPQRGISHRTVLPLYLPRWYMITPVTEYAADGHLGTIIKAYRDYRQTGDRDWLHTWWPRLKLAMQQARQRWDAGGRGVCEGPQSTTYDCDLHGRNSFISGLYLAALRASEEMARIEGDESTAAECRALFERGRRNLDTELWNGEYYIQTYDAEKHKQTQYGAGCHADQLVGQWWAHICGLGHILPREHVRTALQSLFRYNFRADLTNHKQQPRQFLLPEEAGLVTCTWPRGGRPGPGPFDVTRYSDEVWTGLEYAVAGAMLFEGLVDEALALVNTARERHDGQRRNPWNEIECGDHYVRAMSSWTLLEAAAGWQYDADAASITWAPRLTPRDFRSFFVGAQGWGAITQRAMDTRQVQTLTVRYGSLEVKDLRFSWLGASPLQQVTVRAGEQLAACTWQIGADGDVGIELSQPLTLNSGEGIEVSLQ